MRLLRLLLGDETGQASTRCWRSIRELTETLSRLARDW